MKGPYFVLLFLSLINFALAKEVKTIKVSAKKSISKTVIKKNRVICKQKDFPMKVERTLNAGLLTVTFNATSSVDSFSLKNVRGIDGVNVLKFQELINQKLEKGESIESSVEISDFSGLVYVIFDVDLIIKGVKSSHSVPIALGSLSSAQKRERSKNVKEINNKVQMKDGTSPMSAPAKKIHEMKVD